MRPKYPSKCLAVAILAAALAVWGSIISADSRFKSRNFVLVHGAWVGEWYWEELVVALRQEGHRAFAVSLTGHGERAAEGGPHVSIDMHANDIVDAVREEGLSDIILVGHSYGGRPITAAWDELREQVSHIVFVEAVAPLTDDNVAIPQDGRSMRLVLQKYPAWVEEGLIPVPERLRATYSQVLAPQSFRSVYGEVLLKNGPLPPTPGTYIYARDSVAQIFRSFGNRLQSKRGWDIVEIPGGHHVMGDGKNALLAALLSIAGQTQSKR